jgi:hypothetical protein
MTITSGIQSGIRSGLLSSPDRLVVLPRWRLTKTGGVGGSYDAQAYTGAIYTGNVSVEFTVSDVDECGIGLSADNPTAHYNTIDFLVLFASGTAYRAANGVLTSLGTTAVGDIWRVSRNIADGVVSIFKNGAAASTPTFVATSVAPLLVDSFFRQSSDSVTRIAVSTDAGHQPVAWTVENVTAVEV